MFTVILHLKRDSTYFNMFNTLKKKLFKSDFITHYRLTIT